MEIEEAVDQVINEFPENFEIRTFLIGHRAEVKSMCITEYNEVETLQMIKEESLEEGRKESRAEMAQKMIRANEPGGRRSYYIPTLGKMTWTDWQKIWIRFSYGTWTGGEIGMIKSYMTDPIF